MHADLPASCVTGSGAMAVHLTRWGLLLLASFWLAACSGRSGGGETRSAGNAATPTERPVPAATPAVAHAPTTSGADVRAQVDIGGRRLFLACTGAGTPTVVLEAGAGNSTGTWAKVQPAVATVTRACSYDRAGLGQSDPNPLSPTHVGHMATDLHALLTRADVPGPYVLVGHSLGGLIIRVYAAQHPELIAGVVFVNAIDEDFGTRQGWTVRGVAGEAVDYEASAAQVRAAGPFPNVPLAVPAQAQPVSDGYRPAQTALTALSPQGQLVFVERTGHFIQVEQPAAVVHAIRQVVEAARR